MGPVAVAAYAASTTAPRMLTEATTSVLTAATNGMGRVLEQLVNMP